MSNLAQLAAKLQAKDAERSVLVDDIKGCEALKNAGKFGKLLVTVQESGLGGKGCSISYRFVEDSSQNTGNLEDMKPDEECEFALVDREANLEITVKWKDTNSSEEGAFGESTTYNIHTKVIPSNQTIITDVEPTAGSGTMKIRVKASFETLDSIISQKKLSLSEIEEQLQALKVEMKGGGAQTKGKGTASKQSTSTRSSQRSNSKAGTSQDDNDTKLSVFQSSLNMAQQIGMTALASAFEFRAVVMFGVSVVAIGMYGDRLSV